MLRPSSLVSASAGLQRGRGWAVELAGLVLSPTERSEYESVRRLLVRERIQGITEHVRPTDRSAASYQQPFEQRKSWAGRSMLIGRMGGAAAKLRYYKAACGVQHPMQHHTPPLPSDLLAAVRYVSGKGAKVAADRRRRLDMLESCGARLRPLHDRLCLLMPPHVLGVSGRMNLGLVACCVDALPGYPDRFLVHRFVHGFEVVGAVPDSGLFRKVELPDVGYTPVDEVFNPVSNVRWIRDLERSMKATGNAAGAEYTAAAKAAYDSTIKECADSDPTTWGVELSREERQRTGRTHRGLTEAEVDAHPWITGGKPVAPGRWRPIRRFAIRQKGKDRPCDHARESRHNETTRSSESLAGQATADAPASLARAFSVQRGSPVDMEGSTADWPKAYRKSPVRSPRDNVITVWNPYEGKHEYFLLAGFNFGLVSAVCAYNRWPHFVITSARAWLGCCSTSYFDDAFTGEPTYAGGSGQAALVSWAALTGLPFAPDKTDPPSPAPTFIGVVTDYSRVVSHGEVCVRVHRRRRDSVLDIIDAVMADGTITQNQASSLSGKLRWTLCPCFGRVGLALLQPLHAVRGKLETLPFELREALGGLRLLADRMPPRSIPVMPSNEPPTIVFTDASWEDGKGALGVVVKAPGKPLVWTACDCPAWVIDVFQEVDRAKKQYIGQLELLAALLAYTTFPDLLRGKHVVHWIDNESAVYSLVKGYSGAPDSARIVNLYHSEVARLRVTPWLEYVHTDDNIADLPSRGDFGLLELLGGEGSFRTADVLVSSSFTGPLRPLLAG